MIMWEETLSDRTRYARTEEYNKNKNNKQNKTLGNHVDSWLNQDRFLSRRRGSLLAEQSYHKHLSARVCYWICHQPEIQTWKRIFISIRAKKKIKVMEHTNHTSGLLVWRIIHLMDNLSFVSEHSITRSTTVVSPSTPLYKAGESL